MINTEVFIVVWTLDGLEKVDIFPTRETATEFWNEHGGNTYFRVLHIDDKPDIPEAAEPVPDDIPEGYASFDEVDDSSVLWCEKEGTLVRKDMIYRHNQFHASLLAKVYTL